MNIYDHINELKEKTKNLKIFTAFGYNSKGKETIGIRGIEKDPIVDETSWLIAGDVYYKDEKINTMRELRYTLKMNPSGIIFTLRAQSMIGDTLITASLGQYKGEISQKPMMDSSDNKIVFNVQRIR